MKALVLAGGFPQIELIRQLKDRNISVILADWGENPVAKEYSDKFYRASTLDVFAIKKIAISECVDFIITVCTDQALLTMAKVSEDLRLPCYISYQTALEVTNKQYMKERLAENHIPTAKYVISNELSKSTIEGLSFPLIVKPVDCNSSKGVTKVCTQEELEKAFSHDVALSRTHTAIIEEFLQGQELTADVYIENGVANVLSVSVNEKIKEDSKFVIFRQFHPAPISQRVMDKISEIAQNIANVFKLKDSPLLIQLIEKDEEVFVIEFSARTGGGVKYILINKVSGFDVIRAVIDLTLGNKPHVDDFEKKTGFFINEHIYCSEGTFDHLEGFEELKNEQVILDFYLYKSKGASFSSVSNSGDRVAGFTIIGNDIQEVTNKHIIANNRLKVIDDMGNDIARHDLLPVFD